MSARISDYVLAGELSNVHRNSVYGWLEFGPDYGIRLELTGNFTGEWAGKVLRFRRRHALPYGALNDDNVPDHIDVLADRQIGVIETVERRRVSVPGMAIDEFLQLDETQRQANLVEKDALQLEWWSQNGNVVATLVDFDVEVLTDDELDEDDDKGAEHSGGSFEGYAEIHVGLDGKPFAEHFDFVPEDDDDEEDDEDEDPFGLFDKDLEDSVAKALGGGPGGVAEHEEDEDEDGDEHEIDNSLSFLGEDQADIPFERPWERSELDPMVRAMYEQYDEIFAGKKNQPITYLFEKTLRLPKPENVASDAEAEPLVRSILAQLARLSVALDVCEHYTPRQTYHLLMTEILPTASVHPDLGASDMVQHYATSDYCQQCDAEFDAEFNAEYKRPGDDDLGDGDLGDGDLGDGDLADSAGDEVGDVDDDDANSGAGDIDAADK